MPDNSVYALLSKTFFIKIALFCTISEIHVLWRFTQKFKMATIRIKSVIMATAVGKKFAETALSRTVFEINVFFFSF